MVLGCRHNDALHRAAAGGCSILFRRGLPLRVKVLVMPLSMGAMEVIAKRMADRVGHGMSEKCNVFAIVALEMMVEVYNAGYFAGHQDTVEGGFVEIHEQDKASYHTGDVETFVAEMSA